MLGSRDHFLAHIAALAEVDTAELVEIAFVREQFAGADLGTVGKAVTHPVPIVE